MLNHKGQSLVLFILILPILLGIVTLVADLGKAMTIKNDLDNITELVLEYSLEAETPEEKLKLSQTLMTYNTKDLNSQITLEEDILTITTKTYSQGILSNIINIKGFLVESKYRGYIDQGKKQIEKIK